MRSKASAPPPHLVCMTHWLPPYLVWLCHRQTDSYQSHAEVGQLPWGLDVTVEPQKTQASQRPAQRPAADKLIKRRGVHVFTGLRPKYLELIVLLEGGKREREGERRRGRGREGKREELSLSHQWHVSMFS